MEQSPTLTLILALPVVSLVAIIGAVVSRMLRLFKVTGFLLAFGFFTLLVCMVLAAVNVGLRTIGGQDGVGRWVTAVVYAAEAGVLVACRKGLWARAHDRIAHIGWSGYEAVFDYGFRAGLIVIAIWCASLSALAVVHAL